MIAVLTQGGVKDGLGHIMRMLWLLKELGEYAIFLLKEKDEVVFKLIERNGFEAVSGYDPIEDIKPDITFFDKFDVEARLVLRAKRFGKVVLFDSTKSNDLADISINALVRCGGKNCYHGLRYLILRKGFHEFWRKKKYISDKIERILLMFGGSDPSNLTLKVLMCLKGFDVTVVVGPRYPYLRELKEHAKACRLLVSPDNVAELMFEHDLVITSLGLTMFEAMCVGTPALAICQNETQRWLFSNMPFLKNVLKHFDRYKFERIMKKLEDWKLRKDLSDWGKSLCDGLGLLRVVDILKVII